MHFISSRFQTNISVIRLWDSLFLMRIIQIHTIQKSWHWNPFQINVLFFQQIFKVDIYQVIWNISIPFCRNEFLILVIWKTMVLQASTCFVSGGNISSQYQWLASHKYCSPIIIWNSFASFDDSGEKNSSRLAELKYEI